MEKLQTKETKIPTINVTFLRTTEEKVPWMGIKSNVLVKNLELTLRLLMSYIYIYIYIWSAYS